MGEVRSSAVRAAGSADGWAGTRRHSLDRTPTQMAGRPGDDRSGVRAGPGSLVAFALLLFPMTAALGRYATIDLTPRIFPNLYLLLCVLTVVPALTFLLRSRRWRGALPGAFISVVAAWALWAPLSLAWTPVFAFGLDRIALVWGALASGLCVLGLASRAPDGVRMLRLGWAVAFVVTAAIALWELGTGQHLDSNQTAIASSTHIVTSSFSNPNNYAGFLLACLPFLVWNGIAARSVWSRYLHVLLILFWVVLIVATQSRTGIVGALAAVPLLGFWVIRSAHLRRRPLVVPALFVGIPAWVVLSILAATAPAQQILEDLQTQLVATDGIRDSDQARLNLTVLGWRMFIDSAMLGHGAGSFTSIASHWGGLELHGLTNPHNGVIEVAAEYGLPILLPLVAAVCAIAYAAFGRRSPAAAREEVLDFRMVMVLGLVAIVASNLAASSILLSPWWWLLLGQLTVQAWLLRQQSDETADRARHRLEVATPAAGRHGPNAGARAGGI